MTQISSQFLGFGHYVSDRVIHNDYLENAYQLPPGWIKRRTGIQSRRWAQDHETLLDMAENAGRMALNNAGLPAKDIGLMILATSTPDHLLPPTAPLLAHQLGISSSPAFDLAGACTGYLHALMLADTYIKTYQQSVLIVAANILSRRINHDAIESAVLFSDAAGATVLSPTSDKSKGVLGVAFDVDGSAFDFISIPAGGSKRPFAPEIAVHEYKMHLADGPHLFSKAVNMMVACAQAVMNKTQFSHAQVSRFVPHQANMRIMQRVRLKLGIEHHKMVSTISDYGNSSAASIPFSLSLANQQTSFVSGEKILLTAAGAGMAAAAMVIGL